ncbi:hypothetical protein AU476_07595 [Cupriavidus sp. UYMSc13B]|nr:hypothetical protein AU476_07595 [Cupriavidus sp. UYMSc13B]
MASSWNVARVVTVGIALSDLAVTTMDQQLDLFPFGLVGARFDRLFLAGEGLPVPAACVLYGPTVVCWHNMDVWHDFLLKSCR